LLASHYELMLIVLAEIAIQVLIVFVGGPAFQVVSIGGREWGISIALGFMSIPIGYLLRLIPDEPVHRMFVKLRLMADPEVLPVTNPERGDWNPAINLVRDNLTTFANVRGGRLRSSSFVGKSRSARLQEAGVQLSVVSAISLIYVN
jgi:P-type Ca2+ transporter type 2C